MINLDKAVEAAWKELLRQEPGVIDLSEDHGKPSFSVVLTFDGINLKEIIRAALEAEERQT